MRRYSWPRDMGRDHEKREDNPAQRAAFVRRRRTDFDLEGALRVSRATPQPAPHGGSPGPFAPASGRDYLWEPLGPVSLLGGQAAGQPRVSGRVNDIRVHDGGQRAYGASANGGVWYTKDGGANWVSVAGLASTNATGILRPAQRNACGTLYVEFGTNEGEDLVLLGTGEVTHPMTGEPGASEGGIGILVGDQPARSSDPNRTWVREAPNLVNNGIYRIVREPGGNTFLAATRTGLYQRPASPGENAIWDHPSSTPFNSLESDCTDILWTPAVGTSPARLWVWVKEGTNFGLWVRATSGATPETNFKKVTVDPASGLSYHAGRACLAASSPASQVWLFNDQGGTSTSPALFRVTNPAAGTDPVAHGVVGVPNILRDSGFYNIAMAVHPSNANHVALAGSYLGDPHQAAERLLVTTLDGAKRGYDASIVVADVAPDPANGNVLSYGLPVAAPATAYTMIGIGVHPDVHALAYSNAGGTLWAGCDGGIFRSDAPTKPAGFYPRNHGLSISESNFFANHPTCEGHLIAGLQDNGVVVRASTGVWKMLHMGDGGGVVLDAANPDQSMEQYIRGMWYVEGSGGHGPLVSDTTTIRPPAGTVAEDESNHSAFYSTPANIANTRSSPPAASTNFSQTLIGTNRLWYSDDFGLSWVTLPHGRNPLPGDADLDSVGSAITVCRWQSPDVAWALCEQKLTRYARTPGSHNAGGPGAWTSQQVGPPGFPQTGKAKKRPPAPPSLLDASVWTDIAVNLDSPGTQRGTLGALYIGTVGNPTKADVDTLWWFDGTDRWYPTGLRTDLTRGVPAPVTAIVCNPSAPAEVWVGTTVGVWHGTRTEHGTAAPTWEWTQRVNGLPEAAVEDLAIFSDGGLVLLRAAIAARGIWELRLDETDVEDLAYIRAHDDDLRYRRPAMEVKRDSRTPRSWHGSPDVRPRKAPAALPAPATLDWQRFPFRGSTEQLRRFQAVFRASTNDPRIVSNGIWDAYFSEVLRDWGAPTVAVPAAPPLPALSRVQIDDHFWDRHMQTPHDTAEPWKDAHPREADLYELTPNLREGDVERASVTLPLQPLKVDIVVHFRGLAPIDGANVRVTLLRWVDPATSNRAAPDDVTTWPTVKPGPPTTVGWTEAVNDVLNSADGKTTRALPSGWQFVLGSSTESHRDTLAGQTLDPMTSGVATFNLDLTGTPNLVLLVAIIRFQNNIALSEATLKDLALTSPNVAVRSVEITV